MSWKDENTREEPTRDRDGEERGITRFVEEADPNATAEDRFIHLMRLRDRLTTERGDLVDETTRERQRSLPDNLRDVFAGREEFAVTLETSEVRVSVSGAVGPVDRRGQEPDNGESLVIPGRHTVAARVQRIGNQLGRQLLDNLLADRAHLSLGQKVGDYGMGTKLVQGTVAILAGEPEIVNQTTSRGGQSVGCVSQEDLDPIDQVGSSR